MGAWLTRDDAALVRPDHYVFGVARDAASSERPTNALRVRLGG